MLNISRKFTLCSFSISRRYFVALEAAISTKPTLKLSSMLDMCVSLCGFFVHKLQPKLWSIKHDPQGVRLWKTAASLLNRAWGLISGFQKAIFFYIFYLLDSQENYQCPKLFKVDRKSISKFGPVNTYPDILKNRGFFPSVFKKQYSSTRSVFKSFSLLHMKRHKMMDFEIYDSILYRACIMLVVIWCMTTSFSSFEFSGRYQVTPLLLVIIYYIPRSVIVVE